MSDTALISQDDPRWAEGDYVPPSLVRHIRERIIIATGQSPDGQVLTAELAERYYPKAEFLRRGSSCCGPDPQP